MGVWENSKSCENTHFPLLFPQHFLFSQTSTHVSTLVHVYTLIETQNLQCIFFFVKWRGTFDMRCWHCNLKCIVQHTSQYNTEPHTVHITVSAFPTTVRSMCTIWKIICESFNTFNIYLVFQLCTVLLKPWQNLWEALINRRRSNR